MVPRDLGNGDRTPEYTYPVIVGVDGSFAAIRAARWAAAVAEKFAAPLHIVHVAAGRTPSDGIANLGGTWPSSVNPPKLSFNPPNTLYALISRVCTSPALRWMVPPTKR
jgi:Universal stress protein family